MKTILFFLLFMCTPFLCRAQDILSGKVTDEQGKGIEYANVVLLRTDSSFVKGCVSDSCGIFIWLSNLLRETC